MDIKDVYRIKQNRPDRLLHDEPETKAWSTPSPEIRFQHFRGLHKLNNVLLFELPKTNHIVDPPMLVSHTYWVMVQACRHISYRDLYP